MGDLERLGDLIERHTLRQPMDPLGETVVLRHQSDFAPESIRRRPTECRQSRLQSARRLGGGEEVREVPGRRRDRLEETHRGPGVALPEFFPYAAPPAGEGGNAVEREFLHGQDGFPQRIRRGRDTDARQVVVGEVNTKHDASPRSRHSFITSKGNVKGFLGNT
ncbi:hypothetical protein [Amycolatopsis thailandensis]|uniref:hypothetical protein n=1 Tax=Amycolatopsis thailandensis TaxID=589330 RepID=UPI00363E4D89